MLVVHEGDADEKEEAEEDEKVEEETLMCHGVAHRAKQTCMA